jgi:hypothetical protein
MASKSWRVGERPMNHPQKLWWQQASSDHALFRQLRRVGAQECHLLHYLQMATEKLSKAYLWRSGKAPPKSHVGCIRFLKALLDRRSSDRKRIAQVLGFEHSEDLDQWVSSVQPLAYALQSLAPAESNNGPNAEYPWPHEAPVHCPASHPFDLWAKLLNTGQGRKFMEVIERAIKHFDTCA